MMRDLFTLAIGLMLLTSCQDPVQPDDLTQDGRVVVTVRNAQSDPLEGAGVLWQRVTGIGSPGSGYVLTGNDGMAVVVMPQVSINRDTVQLRISPPNLPVYAGVPPVNVVMPVCSDTTLQFAFDTVRPCGQFNYLDTFDVKLCPETGDKTASYCAIYPTSCPSSMRIELSDSGDAEVQFTVRTIGEPATAIEICALFTPSSTGGKYSPSRSTIVRGVDVLSGQDVYSASLTVVGTVECESCDCPTGGTVVDSLDTLCVGETGNLVARIDTAASTAGVDPACQIIATAIRLPRTPGLILQDQVLRTSGGGSYPNPRLTFVPSSTGAYTDTVIYKLQVQRGPNGPIKDCAEQLRVILKGYVDVTRCSVSVQSDTIRKCLYQDSSNTSAFTVHNTGSCPVEVTITTTRPDWFSMRKRLTYQTVFSGSAIEIPPFPDSLYRTVIDVVPDVTPAEWEANPNPIVGPDLEKLFEAEIIVEGCGAPVR
ncbi:MAG: hypothetical protein EHM43_11150, partial [Ignavibacteriae bacterium]